VNRSAGHHIRLALSGLLLGLLVFLGNGSCFVVSLALCRAENQRHHRAACPPIDHHPILLFFLGVAGVSSLMPILGFFAVSLRVRLAAVATAGLGWLGYTLAVLST
jgi:hypothetical protein